MTATAGSELRVPSCELARTRNSELETRNSGLGTRNFLLVLGVTLLALAFRLGALDLAAFAYDDADVVLRARDVAAGRLTLVGAHHSWGFNDPPLLIYINVLTALLPEPAFAALALMAVVNTLAVLQATLLGMRFFGPTVGLLAGLLFAVNPWAIYFGRRAWVEVQPLLLVLTTWSALEVLRGQRRWAVGFFLTLALHVQARLLALAFAPAALATILLAGRRWPVRWSLVGIGLSVLVSAPYGWYLLTNLGAIQAALASGNRGIAGAPRGNAVDFVVWSVAGYNLLPTPRGLAPWLDALDTALIAATAVGVALVLGGIGLCLARAARRAPEWRSGLLLVLWLVLPLGLIAWQSSTVYVHYIPLLYPLPYLLAAIALAALLRRGRRLAVAGLVLLAVLVIPQVAAWTSLLKVLEIYSTDERVEASLAERRVLAELMRQSGQRLATGEAYGVEVPVRFWMAVGQAAEAAAAEQGTREALVLADGVDPLSETQPAIVESFLGPGLRTRYQQPDSLVLPRGQPGLAVLAPDVEPPVNLERLGQRRALVPLPTLGRNMRDGVRVFALPARSETEWAVASGVRDGPWLVHPYRLAGLSHAGRTRAGETYEVVALWTLVERPTAERPALALVAPDGRVYPQREPSRLGPPPLERDQLLLERHAISLGRNAQPGEYRLVGSVGARRGEQRVLDGVGVDLARIVVGGR